LLAFEVGVTTLGEGFDTLVVIFDPEDDSLSDCFVGHRLFNGFLEAFIEQVLSVSEATSRPEAIFAANSLTFSSNSSAS